MKCRSKKRRKKGGNESMKSASRREKLLGKESTAGRGGRADWERKS